MAPGDVLRSSGYKDISVTFRHCESDLQLVEISAVPEILMIRLLSITKAGMVNSSFIQYKKCALFKSLKFSLLSVRLIR